MTSASEKNWRTWEEDRRKEGRCPGTDEDRTPESISTLVKEKVAKAVGEGGREK